MIRVETLIYFCFTVYCLHKESELNHTVSPFIDPSSTNFYEYWDQSKTVPFYLLVVLLPLSSLKSPTFFTKFNAFGKKLIFLHVFDFNFDFFG